MEMSGGSLVAVDSRPFRLESSPVVMQSDPEISLAGSTCHGSAPWQNGVAEIIDCSSEQATGSVSVPVPWRVGPASLTRVDGITSVPPPVFIATDRSLSAGSVAVPAIASRRSSFGYPTRTHRAASTLTAEHQDLRARSHSPLKSASSRVRSPLTISQDPDACSKSPFRISVPSVRSPTTTLPEASVVRVQTRSDRATLHEGSLRCGHMTPMSYPLTPRVRSRQSRSPSALRGKSSRIAEIQVGCGKPDPMQNPIRSQLIVELGLSPHVNMKQSRGGGQNEGIWTLEDGAHSYVLKLVRHQPVHQQATTDTDRLLRLASEYPCVVDDPDLAFPLKIFRCRGPTGVHSHDLIVMRKAPGRALTEVIALKWSRGAGAKLVMDLLEKVGAFLADFHVRYGHKQHCDFHPTNVLYDEASEKLTIIDVGNIGANACLGDLDHFIKGLAIMAKSLGKEFLVEAVNHFRAGYANSRM